MKKYLLSLFAGLAMSCGLASAVTTGAVEFDQWDGTSWVGHRLDPTSNIQLWGHSEANVPTAYPLLALDLAGFGSGEAEYGWLPYANGVGGIQWGALPSFEPPEGTRGDITVSTVFGFPPTYVWTVGNDKITFAKMQNVSNNVLLGRISIGSGDLMEINASTLFTFLNSGTGTVDMAHGGTGQQLFDPNVDGIWYWDDAAGHTEFLRIGSSFTKTSSLGIDTLNVGLVNLATGVTGTAGIANGGSGQTTAQAAINAFMAASGTLARGDVFFYNGTNVVRLAAGTNGKFLKTQGVGADPLWDTAGGATTDNRLYTADATWTNPSPSTPKRVLVRLVGGGPGGGSGRKGAAATVRCGGGSGGGAGVVEAWFLTTDLGSTESITIGAAGAGGASVSSNSTNGNPGSAGGATSAFGMIAVGGNAGGGGTNSSGTAGAAVTNACSVGLAMSGSLAGAAASNTGAGANSASASVPAIPTGGGGGGGINTGNAPSNGGVGGGVGSTAITLVPGGTAGLAAGTVAGGNGSVARGVGTGGGGGAGSTTTNAGAGGNAGGFGAGGGGGGASVDGVGDSGKGGDGSPGYALIITYL